MKMKYKEVWREANGSFAKAPEPVPKQPKESGNVIIALALFGLAAIILTIIFWQFALATGVSVAAGIGANKYFRTKNTDTLTINWY